MWLLSLSLLSAFAQENTDTPSDEQSNSETEEDGSETDNEQSTLDDSNIESNDSETNSPELNTTETTEESQDDAEQIQAIEKMIEEAFSEEALELALEEGFNEESDVSAKSIKGTFHYAYQIRRWYSPTKHRIYSVGISGDPQYWFNQGNWGPTLGLRFNLAASETQAQVLSDYLLGITAGMQFGSFRINTAGSWMWERYFFQYDAQKETETITYNYDELEQMSGVLWEQTLTYTPDNTDLGIQISVGFPFQIFGERDLGEPFVDSFKASSFLNFKSLHLGYTYTQYSEQFIHMTELGFGYLL